MRITIIVLLLLIGESLYAQCSNSPKYWQEEIKKSKKLEEFFIKNYECQREFYRELNTAQKIYFDTVLYSKYRLTKQQYINRWLSLLLQNDKSFFKRFTFFNNYFATHKENITSKQLRCFQKQRGFKIPIEKYSFFSELKKRDLENDVTYLYPLIRWVYANSGVDMDLSKKRVQIAQKLFGMSVGEIGDREQFARYLAIFDREYDYVSKYLAKNLNISQIKAYKLLVILTFLESRGNIFALSSTGAFGPLQLTMHYYMIYGQPNNPFSPKSSLIKLANKFIYYYRVGKTIDDSVIAYKSGSLQKCKDGFESNSEDCRYYYNYKNYMYQMQNLTQKREISRYLTGKSYMYPQINNLNRAINIYSTKQYEPFQYALVRGDILYDKSRLGLFLDGGYFRTLGKMKRSDIYRLQNIYGSAQIKLISDKKVCY